MEVEVESLAELAHNRSGTGQLKCPPLGDDCGVELARAGLCRGQGIEVKRIGVWRQSHRPLCRNKGFLRASKTRNP